ncbi:MAG: phosphatase PAP2 family protein [Ardenticatenaceae bacterium]|nr:phosphatase PAP2 family protein [Ardenticatenaceae bacterium]MCB9446265.1 phosphatase PAP2 family protein [Ardenticatenaceae bacterium]
MNREQLSIHDKQFSGRLAQWANASPERGRNGRFRHTLAWIFARTGDSVFWLAAIAVLFWQKKQLGWDLLLVVLVTAVLVGILKGIFRRQRPKEKKAFATDKYSFPSGHAARATAVAVTLAFSNPILAPLWLIWAVLVSLARVALSRHYMSDVIGGMSVGLLTGLCLQLLT